MVRNKQELRTIIFTILMDGTMIGFMLSVLFNINILIVVVCAFIAWIAFFTWAFLDWFYIDKEAREKKRFIINPGNEDILGDEELELYNGVGLADYEYEQVQIEPFKLLDIVKNDPDMKKAVFDELKNKLNLTGINDESQVEIILPDANDPIKQKKDEHHYTINSKQIKQFASHHVKFENIAIEELDNKNGMFPHLNKKIIKWIKLNHKVNNVEDLRKQNADDIQREIRSKFKLLVVDGFNLKKEIEYIEEEITEWAGRLIFRLLQQRYIKFLKMRELPLFMLYYDYYIYKVKFDREIPTIYKDKNGNSQRQFSKEVYMILPQSWNDSLKFTSREIPFKGYYPICPTVAQIEWVFREFVLKDMPVYLVNSCYYTRQRIQKNLTIDNDKVLIATNNILAKKCLELDMEISKLERANEKMENDMIVNEDTEIYENALTLLKYKNIQQAKKGIKLSFQATKTIQALKWVIVAIFIIIAVSMFLGGMYFGYMNAQNQLEQVLS